MTKADRENRDVLYRRLIHLEDRNASAMGRRQQYGGRGYDLAERAALRWALKIIEEADALNFLPQLKTSNVFDTAAWLKRQDEIERKERERRDRRAALVELNREREPDWDDAMRCRVPGSFESGKR